MEYTFADGTKAFYGFRRMSHTRSEFATFIHGTKRGAQFSGRTDAARVHMFKDQRIEKKHITWTPPRRTSFVPGSMSGMSSSTVSAMASVTMN